MIQRSVKVQLLVFALLSVVGIVYTGFRYVGIRGPGATYTVYADFARSGGIFSNAEVLERGVLVGRVGKLTLVPNGVRVALTIDSKWRIPRDSDAIVADLSAVGEQYVDLRPATAAGPMLRGGDVIPASRTKTPMEISQILLDSDKLVKSVNREHLAVVIDELGKAFDNTGGDLRRLVTEGDKLTLAATDALPQTKALIRDGSTVLDTQRAASGQIKTFSANLALLAQQLVDSDPDIRKLLDNGVDSSREVRALLEANEQTLPPLLGNLVTLGSIQAARLPGLRTLLVTYPPNVANGFFTAAGGEAHFGLVYTPDQAVCTKGYESTRHHGVSPPGDFGAQANLDTYCDQPPTVTNARGARQAPRPRGDDTASRPRGGYPQDSRNPGNPPKASVASYDPQQRTLTTPNGSSFVIGDSGGQQQYLGSQSWKWLLLAPAYG